MFAGSGLVRSCDHTWNWSMCRLAWGWYMLKLTFGVVTGQVKKIWTWDLILCPWNSRSLGLMMHSFRLKWGFPKVLFLMSRYVMPPMLMCSIQYLWIYCSDWRINRVGTTGKTDCLVLVLRETYYHHSSPQQLSASYSCQSFSLFDFRMPTDVDYCCTVVRPQLTSPYHCF